MTEAGSQRGERSEVVAQARVDADSPTGGLLECELEGTEEASGARDGLGDET